MSMKHEDILQRLRAHFPEAVIDLQDLLGDEDHYHLTIQDKSFEGKSRVQQHQLVYAALGSDMGTRLHALALKTLTP